jgi:hypothetical protein
MASTRLTRTWSTGRLTGWKLNGDAPFPAASDVATRLL